ncbi:hypothetical protein [Palleronia abyssalis]|uniref:Uncharacterized protein n=1 Tax=Palleronia abyssalis TaxID=1501240 RepID=A0A2R8BZE7_9RHOB|nr:hypothetical protein [Palleronia abyssalis]SPJ25510.1 hypothetical protein PAA8504_03361 [Palleronia abyssalis]
MSAEQYHHETRAVIQYGRVVTFRANPLALEILDRLADHGHVFGKTAYVSRNEIELRSKTHVLSVCVDDQRPQEITVAVETPERLVPAAPLALERFHICTAATRFVLDALPSDRVKWVHCNSYFVTENGAIVEQGSLAPPDPKVRPASGPFARFGQDSANFVDRLFTKTSAMVAMARSI